MRKLLLTLAVVAAMAMGLVACGGSGGAEGDGAAAGDASGNVIKVGISSDIIPMIGYVEEPLNDLGYELEVVEFDDWVMPNTALVEGSIDCNFFEHEPYMQVFNESNNADLVIVEPKILATPYGFFSNEFASMSEVEQADGFNVALSDEGSNRHRSFLLLQEAGLITLSDEPLDEYYDSVDVVDNPHNIEFVTADSNSLYSLIDEVSLVVEPCSLVVEAGGDASAALYREQSDQYAMGIVVRNGDQDLETIQALNEAFHSDKFKAGIDEINGDGIYQVVEG